MYDWELLGQVGYIWSANGLVCARSSEHHEHVAPRPISMCTTEKHARGDMLDHYKMGKHFSSQFYSHFLSQFVGIFLVGRHLFTNMAASQKMPHQHLFTS